MGKILSYDKHALTQLQRTFRGVLDFYPWKTILCFRSWPRKRLNPFSQGEKASQSYFKQAQAYYHAIGEQALLGIRAYVEGSSLAPRDVLTRWFMRARYGASQTFEVPEPISFLPAPPVLRVQTYTIRPHHLYLTFRVCSSFDRTSIVKHTLGRRTDEIRRMYYNWTFFEASSPVIPQNEGGATLHHTFDLPASVSSSVDSTLVLTINDYLNPTIARTGIIGLEIP